ncbi:FecR domain-containing protein [Chitinophaga nivalis]|uniref:DUF4974 domain-containing protein n=1 Tax=Chitinophaga nivalis TaxID=2991709 RepID=A0ABT3IGS8_9BACT|nr:FecR domain-containing protein [Chitinophaga nivalis]MCW3467151.1 DUF4974 domain-containing protein [Chitinophaga nivalis]MCW3483157.1 DUF4974 domain-containing protein [Chitinophaga nivalis]
MTTADFQQLLEKYKHHTLSGEELQLLQQLVASGEYEADIKADILQTLQSTTPGHSADPAALQAILQDILHAPSPAAKPVIRLYWRQFVAAAVLITAIVTAGMYWYAKPTPVAPVAAVKRNPLAPGSNKAILTLGDNTTISLDSTNNGALAVQGNTQITNTNGALSYQAAGDNSKILYNTVATPRGGQYQLLLADGSKVWLNAASSIRFPTAFKGRERLVEVTGEVYFEINKNAAMPFRVKVNGAGSRDPLTVTVLGTSFNIMAYPDEQGIRTTLVEGAVQLASGNYRSLLQPGFQASLSPETPAFAISPADIEQTLAWKEGKFRFRNTNIQVIMRQLARWYDVSIAFEGNLSDIDLTGVISRRADAGALLKALEATQRVQFTVTGSTIKVMPYKQH